MQFHKDEVSNKISDNHHKSPWRDTSSIASVIQSKRQFHNELKLRQHKTALLCSASATPAWSGFFCSKTVQIFKTCHERTTLKDAPQLTYWDHFCGFWLQRTTVRCKRHSPCKSSAQVLQSWFSKTDLTDHTHLHTKCTSLPMCTLHPSVHMGASDAPSVVSMRLCTPISVDIQRSFSLHLLYNYNTSHVAQMNSILGLDWVLLNLLQFLLILGQVVSTGVHAISIFFLKGDQKAQGRPERSTWKSPCPQRLVCWETSGTISCKTHAMHMICGGITVFLASVSMKICVPSACCPLSHRYQRMTWTHTRTIVYI